MNNQILQIIKESASVNKVMRIIYTEKNGTSEGWRYIEVYSANPQNQSIFAWDKAKNGIRQFIIERIEQAELTDENFIPRFKVDISYL